MMAELPRLAQIEYGAADFAVLHVGQFVLCAVSGDRIALDQLTYWSAEFQEAYRGPIEATQAWLKHRGAAA